MRRIIYESYLKKLSKKAKRNLELGIIVSITLLSILLWDTIVIYPIKLFVILFHEISHGVAAILTGGSISSIDIGTDLGGTTQIEGGIPVIIASAGYLGSLIVGASLFVSAYNKKFTTWLCIALSVILILFTANYITGSAVTLFAIIFAVGLMVSPLYFKNIVHSYVMKILGLISVLYTLVDLKEDLFTLTYRITDAQILESLTDIPAIFWGILWIGISAFTTALLFRYSYKKGFKS